ncbi:MAG TPA: Flp family type IVb pilin [Geminicoccaceae bacterium]|jgi:pilus assembly protein Flp/PilA|nr:Flp family type IVb pilin [Geminicoccaceae bacterium]
MSPSSRTSPPRPRWQPILAIQADETGATAVEYGLIAAMIALAILSSLRVLGLDLAGLPIQSIIDAISAIVN